MKHTIEQSFKSTVAGFVYGDLGWEDLFEHYLLCEMRDDDEPMFCSIRSLLKGIPVGMSCSDDELRRLLKCYLKPAAKAEVGFVTITGTDTTILYSAPIIISQAQDV